MTLDLSLDGESLTIYSVYNEGKDLTWAVDLRGFGGKEVELKLSGLPFQNGDPGGGARLDSLYFSSTVVVPEPSAIASFCLGLGALAWRWRLERRKRCETRD
jgi:hypothetical protein